MDLIRFPFRAAPVLMVFGAAFLVVNDALIKLFAADLPVRQIIAVRAFAVLACCIALMARRRPRPPGPLDRDLLIRTGFTVANAFAFVAAVTALPFALAVFVDLTNILFVALLAPWLLPERLTLWKLAAVAAGLAGAAVMLSLEAAPAGWLICLPLASALAGAGRELWTRRIGARCSAEVLTFYAAAGMMGAALLPGTGGWVWDDRTALAALLGAGVLQGAAMLLMTLALQWGEASFVAPFRLTALIWAALLAYAVFGERFTAAQAAGAGLIGVSLLLLAFSARPERGRRLSPPSAALPGSSRSR